MARDRSGPLLITGFEPFGRDSENPSERVARALAGDPRWETRVLPVAYEAADRELARLLAEVDPGAMLMLGLHGDPDDEGLRLELVAQNSDDAGLADNQGERRFGCAIRRDGPMAYATSLPIDALASRLELSETPYRFSRDAGGFLCNHAFYRGRDSDAERPVGFLHLPADAALSIERQIEAVSSCAECLLRDATRTPRVQFAHGLEGSPRGSKARRLADRFVCATPAMDTSDFEGCVAHHRAVIERFRPDVLVGSSFGGAVVAALLEREIWNGPTLLLAQASRQLLGDVEIPDGVPLCLVHGRHDEVIPLADSRALAGERFPLLVVDDDHALHESTSSGRLEDWVRQLAAGGLPTS